MHKSNLGFMSNIRHKPGFAHSIMIIIVGNGHDNLSSNPGWS